MPKHFLEEITHAVKGRFSAAQSILSFQEYLELLHKAPQTHCRNSAQYIQSAYQHWGTYPVETPTGKRTRYKLFDGEINAQKTAMVAGQEEAQHALFRLFGNFVREGRITRLLLLHGPNGSGKSSILSALMQALEEYSHQNEGALYRFNWIFPSERKIKRSGIGFASDAADKPAKLDSYAHLEGDQIDARIVSPLRDHPLLLLPKPERQQLFAQMRENNTLPATFKLSQYLLEGDLGPRNRLIFDALMAHYSGDFAEVLRHIQVERYYISQRYRTSAVTIEPQMHVDAVVRQVTADHSLAALPKSLSNLRLFEPIGALVDANRGLLEYSDLLKRPLEAFKYLLGTCETGRVNIEPIILYLDLMMLGSANEQNLDQFKEISEFTSFKSRIELLRVPYLLRYSEEQRIYDEQLHSSTLPKPITPHLTELAALWAVLTRLKRPNPKRLPEDIAELIETFTPLEKAKLYDQSAIPGRFNIEQTKQLRKHVQAIFEESKNDTHYEGRIGASPREIRTVILNAAHNDKYQSISPLALFEELEKLVQERSVYRFLQLEPRDGYYDPTSFIETIREVHLDIIDLEFRSATGLIQPDEYNRLLNRYIQHVKAYIQKEKVLNPHTRKNEDPDKKLMDSVEEILLPEDETPDEFRQNVIGKIASSKLENPTLDLNIGELFADYISTLEQDFFSKQRKRLQRIAQHCLIIQVDDKHGLRENEVAEARNTIDELTNNYGYNKSDLQELLSLLLRQRYQQTDA